MSAPFPLRLLALLSLAVGGASLGCSSKSNSNAGSGGSTAAASSDACTQYVDNLIARVAECASPTAQEREDAIAQCQASGVPNPRPEWQPEFAASVAQCGVTLSCEDYLQNLDDLCFPQALATLAPGLISESTTTACIIGENAECDSELSLARETGTSVVAACFRRWSECAAERSSGEPYWTEDHCGTLLALLDDHRALAEPCIQLPCPQVAACLVNAGAFNF